jgi:predicted dehydrogenase
MTQRSIVVVGAGIGASHLVGLAQLPDRYRIAAVCDLNEARGRPLAETFGTAFTTDLPGVLADPTVDIVDICLPPHLHFRACMDALDAGKAVVCEKPLVPSLREADLLTAKVAETGGFLSPVFQYRFGLGTAQLRALIDAGLAGRCHAGSLETHWDRPAAYYTDVDWRGTWAGESGGALLGHAIHIHDLLPSILGPVAQVYADVATRVNPIEVEDCAALSIRMEEGAVVTSSVTLGAAGNISRMRLMYAGFTVESDHAPYSLAERGWTFTARTPTTQAQIDAVLAGVTAPKTGYAGMFDAVADALDGHPGREVTLADARRSLEFVTACYHSARTGQPVRLPLGPDHPLYSGWLP